MLGSEDSPAHDPILEAIRNAPLGEPFTDEERLELDQAVADIAAGRVVPIRHEDVPAWLEGRAREEAALAAE
jgi:predicted transcriptional regulator